MNNKQKGILFSVLTSISMGLNIVIGKLLVDIVNAETMNVLWFAFASILFILFFILAGKRKSFSIVFKNWKKIIIIGFLVTIGGLLWTYGILYSGPTNVAFLIQFTTVFTILFGIIFLKERFTKLECLGILIAVIGVLFLTYGNVEIEILSILIVLSASFCFSLSNFFSKVYVKNIDAISLAGGRSISIFLLILSYSLLTGKLQLNIQIIAFGYAFLGALTGAFLGFILFYKALEVFEISKSMAIRTMEPFLTAIFSFFILSMIPTQNQIGGGVLIVLGIIILSLTKR